LLEIIGFFEFAPEPITTVRRGPANLPKHHKNSSMS
jgi:hypothetical protein